MKMKLLSPLVILITINTFANENWIKIGQTNKPHLSEVEPINKMMQNAVAIKELIDSTGKKEEEKIDDKNWFILKSDVK